MKHIVWTVALVMSVIGFGVAVIGILASDGGSMVITSWATTGLSLSVIPYCIASAFSRAISE